ncbi:MAG: alternative ribosome rescue aminoacyl-tRNA hydrolase ArfB [Phycisphaerales bacterium JB040]
MPADGGQDDRDQAPRGAGFRLAPRVVLPEHVVTFEAMRASGPGGQNVNKRSTKVRLRVMLEDVPIGPAARRRLAKLASANLTDEGELLIETDETRSQRRNREACVERLGELVRRALVRPKPRKKTRPSRGAVERRLKEKKERGERKERRRRPEW